MIGVKLDPGDYEDTTSSDEVDEGESASANADLVSDALLQTEQVYLQIN